MRGAVTVRTAQFLSTCRQSGSTAPWRARIITLMAAAGSLYTDNTALHYAYHPPSRSCRKSKVHRVNWKKDTRRACGSIIVMHSRILKSIGPTNYNLQNTIYALFVLKQDSFLSQIKSLKPNNYSPPTRPRPLACPHINGWPSIHKRLLEVFSPTS